MRRSKAEASRSQSAAMVSTEMMGGVGGVGFATTTTQQQPSHGPCLLLLVPLFCQDPTAHVLLEYGTELDSLQLFSGFLARLQSCLRLLLPIFL